MDFTPPAVQTYTETYTATSNSLNVTTSSNVDTIVGNGTGTAGSTSPLTTNLLQNPGAELGSLQYWTAAGPGTPMVDSGSFDSGINPHTGNYDFLGFSGASDSLAQTVSIVQQGITAAQVDGGTLLAQVSFWEQGLNQGSPSDDGSVTLTFLNGSNTTISTVNSATIDSHDGTWTNGTGAFVIPAGTRSITYTMNFMRNQGSDLDVFFDDNSLTIGANTGTAASSTTLSSTPQTPRQGQVVTFLATVAAASSSSAIPTGTVTLTNTSVTPSTVIGTATLGGDGTASFTYSGLPVGDASIVATYNGDGTYGTSVSTADTFEVAAATTTTTTLTVTPATVAYQTPVTLTASVAIEDSHAGSGQVYFCDAAAAQCSLTANLGIAQISLSTVSATLKLAPGTIGIHNFTATYVATPGRTGSTSAPVPVTVTGKYPSATSFLATGSAGTYSVTGTVVSTGSDTVTPTGTVSFVDTTNSNAVLGSIGLGTGTPGFTAAPAAGAANATGEGSYGQATGDFNGDGFLDLAVENYEENTVSILLGKGDGTFQPEVKYNVGGEPERILVTDLNGDGKLDLVVANTLDSTVGVLLGNGDGTFQAQVTYPASSPVGLAVMDNNGDGFPDVVAGDYYSNTISVLLGNADGTLQAAVTYPTGSTPQTLVEGDFNADGIIDVAVGNNGDNTLGIFLGNGDGTFQPMVTYAVGTGPQGIQTGDFDGDGKLDLAVSNHEDGTIGVLLGNGDGTFQAQVPYPVGGQPVGLVIADFNGDGKQDIAVGNTAQSSLTESILLGNGDGTFQAQLTYPTGNFPYGESVGDFNGDGFPDVGISNFSDGTATVLLSQVTQMATGTRNLAIGGSSTSTHAVEASYSGDTNVSASVSATTTLTGGGAPAGAESSTTLTITPAAPMVGQSVMFTVAVAGVEQVTPTPTGTVTLTNTAVTPSVSLGTITLSGTASGTYSTSALAAGTYTIVASYTGDDSYQASTSTPQTLTVATDVLMAQTITFPSIPNHTTGDSPFTLNATASSGLAVTYAVISGSATVAGNVVTLTGAGTVTIQASQAGNATYAAATPVSQSFTVSTTTVPALTGLSPAGAVAGSAAITVTLTGTSFTATDVVKADTTALTTTFVNATTLTALIPANLLTTAAALPIVVTDSASGNSSTVANFAVEVAPVVVFTGPSTAASGEQPVVTFQLEEPYPTAINCLLTLTFVPATATGIDDPAVQFSSGGRTINVTLPAGSTGTPEVQFQAGTVSGTVTITLTITAGDVNVTPSTVAPVVVVIPTLVPQISAAKMSSAATTFTVTVTGFSNTREIKSAVFHFTPTAGHTISNPDVTVDASSLFATWFSGDASDVYGSSFTYAQPFSLSEDATTIEGVTVTLANTVGSSSATQATQ